MNFESKLYYKIGVLLGAIEMLSLIDFHDENYQHLDQAVKYVHQHAIALAKEIIPQDSEGGFRAFLDPIFNKMGEKG